mmetsp:Transcript_106114/g.307016  ORF Transcript_106114/g.307016 Transcript_106114/m.307016 type:complete len:186 (-) Transcript_106114:41-598(-)
MKPRALAAALALASPALLEIAGATSLRGPNSEFGHPATLLGGRGLSAQQHINMQEQESGVSFRNPQVWGPPAWFFLHSMTLALPEHVPAEQQSAIQSLLVSMQKTLPCPSCGEHLKKHMTELPLEPHLGTRKGMVRWMVDLHNLVNLDCKKRGNWTVDEVEAAYAKTYTSSKHGVGGGFLDPLDA